MNERLSARSELCECKLSASMVLDYFCMIVIGL
jgi:hypothetical protein